jgi:hypothetical protein
MAAMGKQRRAPGPRQQRQVAGSDKFDCFDWRPEVELIVGIPRLRRADGEGGDKVRAQTQRKQING